MKTEYNHYPPPAIPAGELRGERLQIGLRVTWKNKKSGVILDVDTNEYGCAIIVGFDDGTEEVFKG